MAPPARAQAADAATRIAVFSPIFSARDGSHGGITPVVLGLLDGLAELPLSVLLAVRAEAVDEERRRALPGNVTIHCIGRRTRLLERHALARWLRREAPAALLTAGYRFNLVGLRAARAAGVPAVASVHIHLARQLADHSAPGRWIRARQVRATYPLARAVVAVSPGVADDLRARLGAAAERVVTIPNPILRRATPDAARTPGHPWLAEPREAPVLVAAGRLTRQKDYPTLLAAVARLRQRRPCRLIVLGEGEERPVLERLVHAHGLEDCVALPGFRPDAPAWIAAADAFVLSSAWEGFGNVLVEALAAGTPAVSTDCESGPREILQDGRLGPLVPVGDEAALAEAIARVLDAPPDAAMLVEAAQAYRSDRIARRYLEAMDLAGVAGP